MTRRWAVCVIVGDVQANGLLKGAKSKLSDGRAKNLADAWAAASTIAELSEDFGVSRATIYKR